MKIELTKDEWEYLWDLFRDEIACDEDQPIEYWNLRKKLGDEWTEDE